MRLLAKNTTAIARSSDLVWRVIVEVEDWPKWTPTVTKVVRLDQGPFGAGSAVKLKQPAQLETTWRVTSFDDGHAFTWKAKVYGIPMVAGHEIIETPHGSDSFMTIHVSGFAAFALWPLIKVIVGRAIALENRSLKAWCETLDDRSHTGSPNDWHQSAEPVYDANA